MKRAPLVSWIGIGVIASLPICGILMWAGTPEGAAPSSSFSKPLQSDAREEFSASLPRLSYPKVAIDPRHSLSAADYKKSHQEALTQDSIRDPKIKRLLELNALHSVEAANLQSTVNNITTWINVAETGERQTREKLFRDILALTTMISKTYEWQEDELRTLMAPDETPEARIFAKGLVNQDIDPTALLGPKEHAKAAIQDIHLKLYDRLYKLVADSGAPAELFNQQTYDRMINDALAGAFYSRAMQLSSPETQELARAEYQMRVRGKLLHPAER